MAIALRNFACFLSFEWKWSKIKNDPTSISDMNWNWKSVTPKVSNYYWWSFYCLLSHKRNKIPDDIKNRYFFPFTHYQKVQQSKKCGKRKEDHVPATDKKCRGGNMPKFWVSLDKLIVVYKFAIETSQDFSKSSGEVDIFLLSKISPLLGMRSLTPLKMRSSQIIGGVFPLSRQSAIFLYQHLK